MNLVAFNWNSLKTRLTLLSLGMFLTGIWVLAAYASMTLHKDMERMLGDQQSSMVANMASQINYELGDRLNSLEFIAGSISADLLANASSLQTFLESRTTLLSLFNGGTIAYRIDGTAVAEVPRFTGRIGLNYMDVDTVARALQDGVATVGSPMKGKRLQAPVFGMTVPIRDAKGNVIGALAGVTNLGIPSFLDQFTQSKYGERGYFLLEDPKIRTIITGSDSARIMQPLPPPGVNKLIDRHVAGYDDTAITVNPVGVEVLASAARIPVAGWFLLGALPASEAFAPIVAMKLRMLGAAFVLTIVIGFVMWWMLQNQLSPMIAAASHLSTMSEAKQPLTVLPITRDDEVGELIRGFNHVIETLKKRETEIELVRQQQFHKEKMAAIGSLAASVAHEVNNPLSAIVGIAEAIEDESQRYGCGAHDKACQPRLILEQAKRAIAITRQIGTFSVPQSHQPELIDLNVLLRNTCNFVTFDRRFRSINMHLELDHNLPAAFGVADHVTQVLMNLLINAADALQDHPDSAPEVHVRSFMLGAFAAFSVTDNGTGITPENQVRVFDEYFTTKSGDKGLGLGLSLCRRLLDQEGGHISIDSVFGSGTTVTVSLPVSDQGQEETKTSS